MYRSLFHILLLSAFVFSCFEEDQVVPPYAGEVTTITDSVQTHLSYFDLETGRVIASYRSDAWQLGFECGPDGWHIATNSGSNWFIYNTGQTLPDQITTMPETVENLYDTQANFPESTAVGNWVSFQDGDPVYTRNIYLLGYYSGGGFTHIRQLAFLEVNDSSYRFFSKETGRTDTITISKSDTANYVYYSFNHHKQVNLEPGKTKYDLVFGSYYDQATLFGQTIPYLVGGVLLNTWNTEVVLDSMDSYATIGQETIPGLDFTCQRDIPGYRWKNVTVDVTGGGSASYFVKTNYSYIFHTAQDNFFKLRFLSYTLDGRSGFPRFEYRKL